MATEAQNRANRKYKKKAYDRLELQLLKGTKDKYRAQAAAHGMSLNAYIISLLDADVLRTSDDCAVLAESIPD